MQRLFHAMNNFIREVTILAVVWFCGAMAAPSCHIAAAADSIQSPRDDDIAMVMIFSFREASQIHLLAHALGMASLNGSPSKEVVEHCDRAIEGFKGFSVPMLGKYLTNVDHDEQTREMFRQIQVLQERALAEVRAIKSMAESGNAKAERLAFIEANSAYTAIGEPLVARMLSGHTTQADQDGVTPSDAAASIRSPNRKVFSDKEWGAITEEFVKQGLVRNPVDAEKYIGTVVLLKQVFVDKRIHDPSPKQLFGLAKVLNLAFHQVAAEKIETTLATMLRLAKETGIEVASRDTLLKMGDE